MNILKHLPNYSMLAVLLLAGTVTNCAASIAYTYDAAGRIVAADYGAGKSISYAYDNAGNLLVSAQPTPGITVSRNGDQITLAWPAAPAGFVLQSASSINPGAQWNNVGVTPTQMGNLNVVTLTLNSNMTFYRLQK